MTVTTTTLTMTRWEEAIAMITIMTTIMRTKVGGGCKGTAHPRVGMTYNDVVIVRSSLTTTSALATAVIITMLAAVWGGLA